MEWKLYKCKTFDLWKLVLQYHLLNEEFQVSDEIFNTLDERIRGIEERTIKAKERTKELRGKVTAVKEVCDGQILKKKPNDNHKMIWTYRWILVQ